jgi:hypothetical protein
VAHRHVRCRQPHRKMGGRLEAHSKVFAVARRASYAAAKWERCSSMTNSAQDCLLRPELQRSAKRVVSVARIRLDSRKSVRRFKGIFCHDISEFESFSIGAGWCQALSDCSVDLVWDVPRRVLASLRDRHLGPPMMGSKRTRLIHRPCGDIAPPVGGIRVFSYCVSIVYNSR